MNATDTFRAAASDILGPRGFTCDPELVEPWLTDWRGRYTGKAVGLASPASTDELARFVTLCAAHRIPIVPQGGNSGMSGGATPDESGTSVLLSLRRMDAIRDFDVAAQQITCDAGVVLQTLHDTAEERGLRFPLTLGGKGSATVGGLISTNAGGTQVLRHGTMRAQVLGIEAVLADGEIFSGLIPLKKDNRGFDLKQMLIGSEGTLGIITAATLRLVPQIGERRVAWVGLPSISAARELLLHCEKVAGDALEGFEVLPRHCLESVLAHVPTARSPLAGTHEWHALVELVADPGDAGQLDKLVAEVFESAMEHGLLEDAVISTSEGQAETFWQIRDSISAAERAIGPAMQHDISVPVARMAEFVETAAPQVEKRFPGTRAVGFGHLGDGNIHFHVLAPAGAVRGEWEMGDGKAISEFVHDRVTDFGGSLSAEHGIGQMKRDELGRLGDPVALSLMRKVKQALDPQGILNPGKLVPLAPHAATP
ncbi:FAD-binding oxidoreductase [Qipengyuania sp. Mu-71]|uniref:FAD-binding oxidoreductase n=1 Tax=Qipengyuania sp. Mu-71 TaxID=3121477 RepID=UPI002FE46C05